VKKRKPFGEKEKRNKEMCRGCRGKSPEYHGWRMTCLGAKSFVIPGFQTLWGQVAFPSLGFYVIFQYFIITYLLLHKLI
jgi:hypothetical protein